MKKIEMRCTKKQFQAVKTKLEGKVKGWSDFLDYDPRYPYLTNFYNSIENIIGWRFMPTTEEVYEQWDEKIFLDACGISKKYEISKKTIFKYNMKDEFPEVFEKKLYVGKWYKGNVEFESLIFITKIEKCRNEEREYSKIDYFGFVGGCYRFNNAIANREHENSLIEANAKEVEEALIREAKKRGYKNGNYKCLELPQYTEKYVDDYFFLEKNKLWHGNKGCANLVFDNGKWAEIIKTYTKEEAEKLLNCKIIDSLA